MENHAKYIKLAVGETGGENMKGFKTKGGFWLYIILLIFAFAMAIIGEHFLCGVTCVLLTFGKMLLDWANKDE